MDLYHLGTIRCHIATNRLVTRLTNIPGVDFDEGKFRRALKKEGGDIMEFADKHFGDDAAVQKEHIFKF